MKTLLELDSVAARYGPVQALSDVSGLPTLLGALLAVLAAATLTHTLISSVRRAVCSTAERTSPVSVASSAGESFRGQSFLG